MVVASLVKEVQLSTEIRTLADDGLRLLPSEVAEAIVARKFGGSPGGGLTKGGAPASLAASDPLGRGELGVVQKLIEIVCPHII